MTGFLYLNVQTPGPLVLVKVPERTNWRKILPGLTRVMKDHGLRQKDISRIEALVPPPSADRSKEEQDFAALLDKKWGDSDFLRPFWLYEWKGKRFLLVREPSPKT